MACEGDDDEGRDVKHSGPVFTSPDTARVARRLSLVFNPLVFGVPVVVAIAIHEQGGVTFYDVVNAAAVVTLISGIPLLYTTVLMRLGIFSNFNVSNRRERIYLFPMLLLCFAAASAFMLHVEVAKLVLLLILYGLLNCLLCALISFRFKISLHCAGMGGLAAGLYFSFGPWSLVPSLPLLALVAWSRVYAGEHTRAEVAAGSAFGLFATLLELSVSL